MRSAGIVGLAFASLAAAESGGAAPAPVSLEFRHAAAPAPAPLDLGPNLALLQDAPAAPAPDVAPRFGAAESWRFNIHGGGGFEFDDESIFALASVGVSYFVIDDVSIDLELNGMYVDQRGDDPWGANFNLLLRWHFISKDTWSLYVDGGAGMLFTTNDVPDNGSSVNFTPQAGVGGTVEIAENTRLFAGVRWHHISNANSYEVNPGRDSIEVYAGVSVPF